MYINYNIVNGIEYGTVTTSVRDGKKVGKSKGIYLGRVIDKERGIFKSRVCKRCCSGGQVRCRKGPRQIRYE